MNQPFHLINVGWGYGKPYLVAEIQGIFAGHHTVPRGISDEFTRLHFRRDNPSLVSKRTNKYSMEPSLNGSKVLQEPHDKRLLTIFSPYERLILIFINILNVLLLANLLLNRSTVPEVFGRYTRSYAIGVLICLIIAGGVLVFSLNRLQAPSRNPLHALLRYPAIAWALLVIISIGGASIFPAGDQIKTFVLLDAAVAGLYIAIMDTRVAPLASLTKRRFMVLSSVLLLIILVLNLGAITSIPGEQSAGDEADWASFAVNWMRTGNVATWISNEPQLPIVPGVGYGVSLLGRWFQVMGVGFVQGRLLVWIFFALGVGSVGIAAWQLFDVPIALMCMIVAASSRAFLNHRFIRPEVALPFIAALAFATYIASNKKPLWGFLCGWLCILSLESHAAGAAYIFSLTAIYATDALQDWRNGHNPLRNLLHRPLQNKYFTFALGISVGTALYIILHILRLPQPDYYFVYLHDTRDFGASLLDTLLPRVTSFIDFARQTPIESVVFLVTLAALVVRRQQRDWILLRLTLFTLVGYILIVPVNRSLAGYMTVFVLPFALNTGAWVYSGLKTSAQDTAESPSMTRLLWQGILVFGLAVQMLLFLRPSLPYAFNWSNSGPDNVSSYVRSISNSSMTVVGNALYYWQFIDYPGYYREDSSWRKINYQAFLTDKGVTTPQITAAHTKYEGWQELAPVIVFHTSFPNFPAILPDLKSYLDRSGYTLNKTIESGFLHTEVYVCPGFNQNNLQPCTFGSVAKLGRGG